VGAVDRASLDIARRSITDTQGGSVTVTDPDGKQRQVTLTPDQPGRFTAHVPATTPGVWQVAGFGQTAFAAAGPANPLELADLRATASLVGPLARASGGSVHFLDPEGAPALRRVEPGRDAAGGSWIGLPRRHDYLVTGIASLPLLPPWLALPLILGLAVVAWRREGA